MHCSQVEIEIERTLYKFLRSGQPRVMQLALFHSDIISVSDPYSYFTDPDPVDLDGGQYGSGYRSGSNPDPGLFMTKN
jgi:hypothetical protein